MTPDELKKNVDTIIVVMMENRSFDNVLGHLRHPLHGNRTDINGIEDLNNDDYANNNSNGQPKRPFWMSDATLISDLPHGPDEVQKQLLWAQLAKRHLMTGFVQAFEDQFHSQMSAPPVMGLLTPRDLPTTASLADQYTVCDNWFACLPTSTAPNRLMSMAGSSQLRDTNILVPNQDTVYDWLSAHGVSWRVYAAGLPFFALMPRMTPLVLSSHFRRITELPGDIAAAKTANDWPDVIFIEPDYFDAPVHFQPPCCNHPPLGMAPGEAFVGSVYNTFANDPKWQRSVFIVTYDEHGGFFDHVPPLPIHYRNPNGVTFETTGPRLPTIVCGPYAPKRGVSRLQLDNTSILQLIAERFGALGEAYSSEVHARAAQGIDSVSKVLDLAAKNTAVSALGAGAAQATPTLVIPSNIRQGFIQAARDLKAQHKLEALSKYPEIAPL
ncbi:MAG: Phospholipase 4 [Myxococcales bacterium]|nr:Phospholipase 4 [Myxococcales bacterium]